ncbi:hypothetical protein [Zavarzinia aquatilis]|uniref:Ig-like domain-containing protein n=1 Tax=Zavarzinia aquatilis TaxID=2211142 RepID=A0A317DX39_9PROT|nr:hypothetical protein [Zavarzinia aquatilis]PWR18500.1 hypothetical protein DKG74_18955 [Zavarzinia aquatilis]
MMRRLAAVCAFLSLFPYLGAARPSEAARLYPPSGRAAAIAAGCGEAECCEKSLGSPRIELRWRDALSDETLHFRWSRNGGSTLSKINAAGQRTTYFCLVWAALRLD